VSDESDDRASRTAQREREIDDCVRALEARDPRARALATERLGQLRARPDALLQALDDPNSYVREAAARALGSASQPGEVDIEEALLAALDDKSDHVCAAAIRSLGRLQVPRAEREILPFLRSSSSRLVQASLVALARVAGERATPHIDPFLAAPDPFVRATAAHALGLVGHRAAGPRIAQLLQEAHETGGENIRNTSLFIEAIATLRCDEAIPLLTQIAIRNVGLRSAAVEALLAMDAASVAPVLSTMLADPSTSLRKSLLELIQKASYRPALPLVRALLDDPTISIRRSALAIVVRFGDLASADRIRTLCRSDPNPHLRPQAVKALAELLGPRAVDELLELLLDPNVLVRAAAARGLAQVGGHDPRVIQALAGVDLDAILARTADPSVASARPSPLVPAGYPLGTLRDLLEGWQRHLPTPASQGELEHLSVIDQALSTLLDELRRAEELSSPTFVAPPASVSTLVDAIDDADLAGLAAR
jgi:HEAT repeat protein